MSALKVGNWVLRLYVYLFGVRTVASGKSSLDVADKNLDGTELMNS